MNKLNAKVTKGYPLWYAESDCYLTTDFIEVADSPWLQAQIAAGLVEAADASPAVKPKTTPKQGSK